MPKRAMPRTPAQKRNAQELLYHCALPSQMACRPAPLPRYPAKGALPCPAQPNPAQPSPAQGCAALPVSVLPCPQRNLHNKEICPILMSTLPCLAQPSPKIRYPTQGEICIIEKICPILTFTLPQAKGPLPALPSHT